MKTIPVKTETVDVRTGEVVKRETIQFGLVPPSDPNVCQTCATDHPSEQPHNAQSLHYQYAFYGEHGRWPTWRDAVAHCTDDVRVGWERELRKLGAWTE